MRKNDPRINDPDPNSVLASVKFEDIASGRWKVIGLLPGDREMMSSMWPPALGLLVPYLLGSGWCPLAAGVNYARQAAQALGLGLVPTKAAGVTALRRILEAVRSGELVYNPRVFSAPAWARRRS